MNDTLEMHCKAGALYNRVDTFNHVMFTDFKHFKKYSDCWHKAYKHYHVLLRILHIFTTY